MKTERIPQNRWYLLVNGLIAGTTVLPYEADSQFALERIVLTTKKEDMLTDNPASLRMISRPVQHEWLTKNAKAPIEVKEPKKEAQPEVKPSLEQSLRDLSLKLYGHAYGFVPEREKLSISISIS